MNTWTCRAQGTLADGRQAYADIEVSLEYLHRANEYAKRIREDAELRVLRQYYLNNGQVPERVFWLDEGGDEIMEPAPLFDWGILQHPDDLDAFPESRLRDTRDRSRRWTAKQIADAWLACRIANVPTIHIPECLLDELARRTKSELGR